MTDPALTRALLAAMRRYTDAQRAELRDEQEIEAARAELDALEAQRNAA